MMKLLVSDLDGTLLKIGDQWSAGISEQNRQALHEFIDNGGHLAVASSRGKGAQQMVEEMLDRPVSLIGSNGFEVWNEDHQLVREHWMDLADFAKVAKVITKVGINGSLVTRTAEGNRIGVGTENQYPHVLPENCPKIRKNWSLEYELYDGQSGPCSKLSLFVEPKYHASTSMLLHQCFDDVYEIAASDIDMLDISPIGINKGTAILELAESMGISRDEICVVGDNENDMSMFDVISKSYCMDHAPKHVLNKAAHVVSQVADIFKK